MHSETAFDELDNGNNTHEKQNIVGDFNIPGFVDDAVLNNEVLGEGEGELSQNGTDTARVTADAHTYSSAVAAVVPVPDFDGAVISVFAIAVILLVVGQVVVVCRHRQRHSCRRRCRKWNVPAFGQLHGLMTTSHGTGPAIHSPPPSEVWTALRSSPLSDLFHSDNYRTQAFAYINRRSSDSLPSTAAVDSRTGSSGSSTAAIFVRPGSSVTWSDVGEMTSSSPEKRPTTSLSLSSSSDIGEVATPSSLDAETETVDGQATADDQSATSTVAASNDAASSSTDNDVNVTSSASVSCSPMHSIQSACDDEVDNVAAVCDDLHRQSSFTVTVHPITQRNNLGHAGSFTTSIDHSQPASPTSVGISSSDIHYIELTTDCSTARPHSDNSTC